MCVSGFFFSFSLDHSLMSENDGGGASAFLKGDDDDFRLWRTHLTHLAIALTHTHTHPDCWALIRILQPFDATGSGVSSAIFFSYDADICRFLCHCRIFLVSICYALIFFPRCISLNCFRLVWIVVLRKVVPRHSPVVWVTRALRRLRVAPLTSVLRLQSALSWALSKNKTHNRLRLIAWKQIKLHQTTLDYYMLV